MTMDIRKARPEDVKGITFIYNHAILHTTATFDTNVKSVGEMEVWYKKYENPLHPLLVAVKDEVVVGYGCLNPFKEKDAYRHTVENSLYVHPDYVGQGIGKALLKKLIEEGRKIGHQNLIAVITEGNDTSIALHKNMGFCYKGTLHEVGEKWETWLSIHYYQLSL